MHVNVRQVPGNPALFGKMEILVAQWGPGRCGAEVHGRQKGLSRTSLQALYNLRVGGTETDINCCGGNHNESPHNIFSQRGIRGGQWLTYPPLSL